MSSNFSLSDWVIEPSSFGGGVVAGLYLAVLAWLVWLASRFTVVSGELTKGEKKAAAYRTGGWLLAQGLRIMPILVAGSVAYALIPIAPPVDVVLVTRARSVSAGADSATIQWQKEVSSKLHANWIDAGPIVDEVLRRLPQRSSWNKSDPGLNERLRLAVLESVSDAELRKQGSEPSYLTSNGVDPSQFPSWFIESVEMTVLRLLGTTYNVRKFHILSNSRRTTAGTQAWDLAKLAVPSIPHQGVELYAVDMEPPVLLVSIVRRCDDPATGRIKLACHFRVRSTTHPTTPISLRLRGVIGKQDIQIPLSTPPSFNSKPGSRIEAKEVEFQAPGGFQPTSLEQLGGASVTIAVPAAGSAAPRDVVVGLKGPSYLVQQWQETISCLKSESAYEDCRKFISLRFVDLPSLELKDASDPAEEAKCSSIVDLQLAGAVAIRSPIIAATPSFPASLQKLPRTPSEGNILRARRFPNGNGIEGRFGWERVTLRSSNFQVPNTVPQKTDVLAVEQDGKLGSALRMYQESALVWRVDVLSQDKSKKSEVTWIGLNPVEQHCMCTVGNEPEDLTRFSSFWVTVFQGIAQSQKVKIVDQRNTEDDGPMLLLGVANSDSYGTICRRAAAFPLLLILAVYAVISYLGMRNAPRRNS